MIWAATFMITSHGRRSQFRLSKGTLLIFKAPDDEFFCHEAAFRASSLLNNPQGHRFCFVFRWLTVSSWFATGPSFAYQGPHNTVAVSS